MARFNRSLRQGPLSRTPRRATSWFKGPDGIISTTTSSVIQFATGAIAIDDGLTLVRFRGELLISLVTATGVLDGFEGAFGVCIVSENAFAAGIASIPTPISDIAWDGWMVYQMFHVKAMTATFSNAVNAVTGSMRVELDSKAMRKFKSTDVLVAVTEVTEVGTAQLTMQLQSRILVKLH